MIVRCVLSVRTVVSGVPFRVRRARPANGRHQETVRGTGRRRGPRLLQPDGTGRLGPAGRVHGRLEERIPGGGQEVRPVAATDGHAAHEYGRRWRRRDRRLRARLPRRSAAATAAAATLS